jgi:ATP-binding cassette, subfamily B, bacterial MsbA
MEEYEMRDLYFRLRRFFQTEPYAREAVPDLIFLAKRTFGWLLLCEIALVCQIYPQRWFMDALAKNPVPHWILLIPLTMLLANYCGTKMHERMDNWRNNFNHRLFYMWWSAGHRKELELSTAWHVKHGTGEKEALIQKNISKIEYVADYLFFQALPVGFRVFLTSLAMFVIGWKFALLALLTFVVYAVVFWRNSSALKEMASEYHYEHKFLEEYGSQLTQNWRPIRAFGQENHFSEENKKYLHDFWQKEIPRHWRWRRHMMHGDYIVIVSRACLYTLLGYTIITQPSLLSFGLAAIAGTWMERVYSNYYNLSDCLRYLHRGSEALREVLSIFETQPDVKQPEHPQWPSSVEGAIEFRNVGFSYAEGGEEALRNINLSIKPRQVVAIIGSSGSGKTTLANLIALDYHPTTGSVLLDGVDLKNIDQQRYRREVIGMVGQQPQLFDATVSANIRLGDLSATDERVFSAAQAAHAHEFISDRELGYDTMIGENGIRLSGGQKQRLTIARALVRQPPVLIFDEATSSLDCESQLLVQRAIDEQMDERACTTFIIAHRFSTIERADLVIALDKGRIVEMGTHEELMRRNGLYARFLQLETQGFLK